MIRGVWGGSVGSGWFREECGCGGNSVVSVSVRTSCPVWPGVSVKTFSAYVVIVFRLIVHRKRFSTHEETEKWA